MSTAGQIVGGVVGAVVGWFAGGPSGAAYGFMLGYGVGAMVDPPKGPTMAGPRLHDLSVQTANYGAVIPRLYGTAALYGNVFWLENNQLKEVSHTTGGDKGEPEITTYAYYATFAVGLCEGPIKAITRVWVGSKLIYDSVTNDPVQATLTNPDQFRVYYGTTTQSPDPRIQADLGVANTPAYRGLAYLVFYDLPLAEYGNTLPGAQVKVEVVVDGNLSLATSTRELPVAPFSAIGSANGTVIINLDKWQSVLDATFAVAVDGGDWRYVRLPKLGTMEGKGFSGGIPYGNGVYVACTEYDLWASPDGFNWGLVYGNQISFVIYGPYFVGGWFICPTGYWSNNYYVLLSQDGRHWERTVAPDLGNSLMAYNGSIWVAIKSGVVYIAEDPHEWTLVGNPFSSTPESLASDGQGLFVTVRGAPGATNWTSTDGVNWVRHDSFMPVIAFTDLAYYGGRFMVIGHDKVGVSFDGINWESAGFGLPDGWSSAGSNWTLEGTAVWGIDVWAGNDDPTVLIINVGYAGEAILGDIVQAECLKSGVLTAADLDVTSLTPIVKGYRVTQANALRSVIEPLQQRWPFDVVQSGYKIKFVLRGSQSSVATIQQTQLGAGKEEADLSRLGIIRESDTKLPTRVNLRYVDFDREHEQGDQYAERLGTLLTHTLDYELPVVMRADEAAQAAEVLLRQFWAERRTLSFKLPPTYVHLEPTDVITLQTGIGNFVVRIESITYSAEGLLEVTARETGSAAYSSTAVGGTIRPNFTVLGGAGLTQSTLLDMPAVIPEQDHPGYVIALYSPSTTWSGGTLYVSADQGGTWNTVASQRAPGACVGFASDKLASHSGIGVDAAGVLTVSLVGQGTLSSCTWEQLMNGQNLFAYGADGRWEIIAARLITQNPNTTWTLMDFRRGLYGTEWATGLHIEGDTLIKLDNPASFDFAQVSGGLIGVEREYRAVSYGRALDTVGSTFWTYQGVNVQPLAPVYPKGVRNVPSTSDWTLSWVRRTRMDAEWRDLVDVPLNETEERYEIEFWNSSYTLVRDTRQVVDASTFVYTSAMQVAAFGSNQASLYLRIYQISSTVGRGRYVQKNLP